MRLALWFLLPLATLTSSWVVQSNFAPGGDSVFLPRLARPAEMLSVSIDRLRPINHLANHLQTQQQQHLQQLQPQQQQGWLSRWLSLGGEGEINIDLDTAHFSLPHRPAAFPSQVDLPLSGIVTSFAATYNNTREEELACVAAIPSRFALALAAGVPVLSPRIMLIERGACDFATKVRAAQDRGAAGVVVGDSIARGGESEREGREREGLITMFSPDTEGVYIPSVFVSRASFLLLRDLIEEHKAEGLWIDISEGADEGGALSGLLSFALLLPSLFLLATIAVHRIRVSRQREADRAPPLIVLSLPERIWTPDIVWEKEDSESGDAASDTQSQTHTEYHSLPTSPRSLSVDLPPPPPISIADVPTPPAIEVAVEDLVPSTSTKPVKPKTQKRQYYSKDECAICMESFASGDIVRILPCGHVFHKEECDEWLLKWRKLCPTCRADVTLPAGGNIPPSSTLTPVASAGAEPEPQEQEQEQSWLAGIAERYRAFRTRRVRLEEDREQGERNV